MCYLVDDGIIKVRDISKSLPARKLMHLLIKTRAIDNRKED